MKRGLIQLGEVWGQISEKYRKFKQIKKKLSTQKYCFSQCLVVPDQGASLIRFSFKPSSELHKLSSMSWPGTRGERSCGVFFL